MGWEQVNLDVIEPSPTGAVEIPHTRVRDAFSARQVCLQLLDNDRLRGRERAKVQGMLDGNAPYDAVKLRSMGQGWRSNLNFMEAFANLQSIKTPYFALIASVPYFAEIRTNVPDVHQNSEIITEEFTNLIKGWEEFSYEMQIAQAEMLKYGVGPVMLSDMYDWRFKALRNRELLVPEKQRGSIRTWPFFAIRCEMTASDLWDKVRPENSEASKEVGWDIEQCRMAVMYASRDIFNGRLTWDGRFWEQWQEAFKDNDIYYSFIAAESLMVYHFFIREYSGRVSHYIVAENPMIPDFLFSRVDRYKDYGEVLTILRGDIGNGTYHSIRGVGRLQYQHLEVTNRLKNHLIDMAIAGTAINLKAQTSKARDELRIMQFGPINILPPDVELVQNRVVGFLSDAMNVDRDFTFHLNANLGTFRRPGTGYGGGGQGTQTRPTATQVQQDIVTQTQLSQGQIVLHFLDLDLLYKQMYRRASDPNTPDEASKVFQAKCQKRGVPLIAMRNIKFVRACRIAGYGSPQVRELNTQRMMPFLGMLPESGRYNFVRDQVISIAGPENIDRYFPEQRFPTHDAWEANMENGVMLTGQAVMIADGQKHAIHADVHLTQMEHLIQHADSLYSQMPPSAAMQSLMQVQQFTTICVPHTNAHLNLLANDPLHQRELGDLQSRMKQVAQNMAQIDAIVQQTGEQISSTQGAQQSAQTKDQIKLQQAQNEMQIDRALAASKIQNQRIKAMSQIQTEQQKAQAKTQNMRQQLTQQVGQANILQSPVQPAGGINGNTADTGEAEEFP
jgi:hypothetical protein